MNTSKDKKEKPNLFVRIIKYLFPWKGDRTGEIIRKIVFLSAAVVLVITLSIILNDTLQRASTNKADEERANLFHSAASEASQNNSLSESASNISDIGEASVPAPVESEAYADYPNREVLKQFEPLLEINPETIGWLTIQAPDADYPWIDYVVMQTDDNDKYLSHNFEGKEVKSGALFVDYHEKITPTSEPANIVVYGHNMKSGEYFGKLPYYFNYGYMYDDHNDISFYKNHPTVEFSTLYKKSTYKIFAAMMLNTEEDAGEVFPYYQKHSFKDRDDFNEYCAEILDRSTFYNPDVTVRYGDRLLTMSTCISGYGDTDLRFVLFARETREGESPNVDVNKAYANPNPKFYDLYYRYFDYTWNGRKWDKNLIEGYNG